MENVINTSNTLYYILIILLGLISYFSFIYSAPLKVLYKRFKKNKKKKQPSWSHDREQLSTDGGKAHSYNVASRRRAFMNKTSVSEFLRNLSDIFLLVFFFVFVF